MGISVKTVRECTCDVCRNPCDEYDGRISIQVNSGDGRDVGPATIEATLRFNQPYGCQGGIVCEDCKMKFLRQYVSRLDC